MGLKIGICGAAGGFSRSFIPLFQAHPLVDEVYLADLRAGPLAEQAAQFRIRRTFASLDDLCKSDCDCIALFTQRWAHAPQAVTDRTTPSGNGRLLYIEDNAVNVMLVEELVHSFTSLSIVSEVNGLTGVARAQTLLPDLILVDMQLPDIDGFEVLRRLRADPRTAGIRCVALSANAMPDDIARARAAGFDDYWTKPIDIDQFLAALSRLF
mgnify:CR=1 FL=1